MSLFHKPKPVSVSTVKFWARRGSFPNEEQTKGALFLAFQQYMDGLGSDSADWIGLTTKEWHEWHRDGHKLPESLKHKRNRRKLALESLLSATWHAIDEMAANAKKPERLIELRSQIAQMRSEVFEL